MEANITNAKIEDAACIYLKWRPITLTHASKGFKVCAARELKRTRFKM
jgi:hypothetical protein